MGQHGHEFNRKTEQKEIQINGKKYKIFATFATCFFDILVLLSHSKELENMKNSNSL